MSTSVEFTYFGLSPGRHNLTVRSFDIAGNVADVISWIFSIDLCASDNSCIASTPHMAPTRTCTNGYYLSLTDDNICRTCAEVLGCEPNRTHCTNRIDAICGDCVSGFNDSLGRNTYDCEFVSLWPKELQPEVPSSNFATPQFAAVGSTVNCSEFDTKTCKNINGCALDWATNRCREFRCEDITDKALCMATDRCEYITDKWICNEVNAEAPCSTFWEEDLCPTDRCRFNGLLCVDN